MGLFRFLSLDDGVGGSSVRVTVVVGQGVGQRQSLDFSRGLDGLDLNFGGFQDDGGGSVVGDGSRGVVSDRSGVGGDGRGVVRDGHGGLDVLNDR